MNEYLMSADECEEFGLTFEAEDNDTAIKKLKETVPKLASFGSVWNLYIVERGEAFSDLHTCVDETGAYHQVFVQQAKLEDDETGLISLVG
jgi:hypothetical protein